MYKTVNFEIVAPMPGDSRRVFGREAVHVREGDPVLRTHEDVDLYVKAAKEWGRVMKGAIENGRMMFAGPQYRLSEFNVDERGITLRLGLTDYGEFIGTNVLAGRDEGYMWEMIDRGNMVAGDPDAFFSNALAVCSSVRTADEKVVVGLRSDRVGEYPRCWHTIGGHPNPVNYANGKIDLFDAMRREVVKELGIEESHIGEERVTGLVRNTRTRKPELLFHTELNLEFDELKRLRGPEKDEHLALFGVTNAGLVQLLNSNQGGFEFPAGHDLTADEMERLRPKGKPDNTSNFLVPPGEASWIIYLAHHGTNILRELPYVRAVGV